MPVDGENSSEESEELQYGTLNEEPKSMSWVVPVLLGACCQANIVGMNDSKVVERTTTIRVE